MLSYGQNITSAEERLQKIPVADFHRILLSPRPEVDALIRQLRIVRQISPQQYTQLKRRLPFIVCAHFNPPFRRSENFASTTRFILDLDHLSDKNIPLDDLRTRLAADPRVELLFLSPSGDGLKILMRLASPCSDKGLFSLFYKAFLTQFAATYQLEQVADTHTSDVARACFLSSDPQAHYNPRPIPIDISAFIDTENTLSIFSQPTQPTPSIPPPPTSPVSDDSLSRIKQILALNTQAAQRAKKEAYVPEQLNDIIGQLKPYIEATGTLVQEISNIQYGKKIKTILAGKHAETNLFYGKRGFSVVISPKAGTDPEANQLMADLIQSFIATHT